MVEFVNTKRLHWAFVEIRRKILFNVFRSNNLIFPVKLISSKYLPTIFEIEIFNSLNIKRINLN